MSRLVVVPVDELEALLDAAMEKRMREWLSRIEPLLPPYSQHALPQHTRKKEFLAAIAAGCPHRRKGPLFLVERADWSAWVSRPAAARAPGSMEIRAIAHPTPANDAPPETDGPAGARDVSGVLSALKAHAGKKSTSSA
jgi:hypothetical protein